MPDISQDLPVRAAPAAVFAAVSTPAGLDQWWTLRSEGSPRLGADYLLDFGPGYRWTARVTRCAPDAEFELQLLAADDDWTGTRVRLQIDPRGEGSWLRFLHSGWPAANEHYRVSCHCWAMYLRVLRRHLEHGETVSYESRLNV
jgi:uncharacterized protein YndB with AHSA1/START domain